MSAGSGEGLPTSWDEPAGATPRGTVVVVPGRGEGAAEYQRLGRRISSENWKVRLVPLDLADLEAGRAAVEKLLADESLTSPKVLLGVDAAATWVGRIVNSVQADAAIVTGAALPTSAQVDGWEAEVEARSACPIHRQVLAGDEHFQKGALNGALPAEWAGPVPAPEKPTLVLHGDADPVTPLADALAPYRGARAAQLKVVHGGRHDVVNDAVHRSVAATVVLFLESLRLGPGVPPIVEDVTA